MATNATINIIKMLTFIILFFSMLLLTIKVDQALQAIIKNKYAVHIILHGLLLPILTDRDGLIWLILSVLHGFAHLANPVQIEGQLNKNFTLLGDYIIHAI